CLGATAYADITPENQSTLYITRYQTTGNQAPVYGLFDLGDKPSVKIVANSPNGGTMTLRLHGRFFHMAVEHPFALRITFEDVTGRVFGEAPKIEFQGEKQGTSPTWFAQLENIAGYYGDQNVTVKIPAGTSVINLLADDDETTVSPNQLMGY